ncbi:MAG: RNA methyltransferase [Nitrospiraceae bacterium]|nr:MAG: RNA methyltransferase [Nitrospiraceae bacterium]
MNNWKKNIYFILVEPKESGNIGSAARAMNNMDFHNLRLVNPPSLDTDEARMFAHGSREILKAAESFASLEEALKDMQYVVGTTRRRGRRRGAFIPVDQGTGRLYEIASANKVAILFGREDRGLFNSEVDRCGFMMNIPANKKQPSINLAHSVMIIAYELSMSGIGHSGLDKDGNLLYADVPAFADQKAMSHLYERIENALRILEYIPHDGDLTGKKAIQNIMHCLGRAGLSDWELNMFHGICRSIENKLGNTDN